MITENSQYLIELFSASNRDKKLDILAKVAEDKDDRLLSFYITCLADENWSVRKAAADIIKTYGEAAAPILSSALNSYNHDVQHWALQILSEIGPKGSPSILRAMKSPNEEIRYFACTAVGNTKLPQGVTMLLRALGDERWRVRKAASDALCKYGESVIPPLQQVFNLTKDGDIKFWTIKTLGKLGPRAQRFLLEALKNGDKSTRYVIAAALGESGDKRIVKVLIESLADPDWTIRKSATMALAEIGEAAFDQMSEYLRSPNEEIRDGCLRAMVKAGNSLLQRLFDDIVQMQDNQRYLVRCSLVKIGSRVVEPLMRLFKLNSPEVLTFAASALGEIGSPRAVPVLIAGLSNESWNVRRSCAYALSEIGERGVEKISEALASPDDNVRYWITRILEGIGEPGVPYLVKALSDTNREIRYFAAKALGASFDPTVVRNLINSLNDEIWGVRKAAADSICKLDNLKISEILRHVSSDSDNIKYWVSIIINRIGKNHIPEIAEAMHKGDPELRLCACQAAGMFENTELIEPLIIALRDDNEWVRTYAAISLGNTGDKRAIIPLIKSFSDRNADLHKCVKRVFEKMGNKIFNELFKCLESDDTSLQCNALKALAEMKNKESVDQIILLAESPSEEVRIAAIDALGAFAGFKSRAILTEALQDESAGVRAAAIKSLGEFGSEQDIVRIMQHTSEVKDPSEARAVKRTLGDLALRKPDIFIKLFESENNALKSFALEALVAAGIDALAPLTQAAAASSNKQLVFWCKKAIKQIKTPKESMFYV